MKLYTFVLLVIILIGCSCRHIDSNTSGTTKSVYIYPANQLKPQNCEKMSGWDSSGTMVLENCETAKRITCTGYVCVEEKE